MDHNKLPKVMVVSTNAWRDNTGINTLIDFFKCWDANRIAQIYAKSALPKTSVCNKFFRISENAMIKSVLNRKVKPGSEVFNETEGTKINADAGEENKRYANKGKRGNLLSFLREIVWKFGKWRSKELDSFIDDFDADVLFIPVYPTTYMCRIQKYVMKRAGKPVVSYLADDNYSFKNISKSPLSLFMRLIQRKYVRYIVKNSSKLLVIAPKQKEEYDRIFGCDCDILTKGIDFSQIVYEEKPLNKPIKMVYTGKLIIGRWLSLSKIAEALGDINKDGVRMELDIYTTDTLSAEQENALNRNGCSVKGALSLDEVQKVQRAADVLVFVESLEKKYKNAARLSFSTKITDYLKNGKCIFAIGDKGIAPIDYFDRYDSAVTAATYDEIGEKLKWLADNPEQISVYSRKAFECGKEHHDKEKMNKILTDAIICASGKEDV